MKNKLHEIYLPFSKDKLKKHFAKVRRDGKCKVNENYLNYYERSVKRYINFMEKITNRKGMSISKMKKPCQIEKDERFWIVSALMEIYYSENRKEYFKKIFTKAFGEKPQIKGIDSWDDCLKGELNLFFEANLPSPKLYKEWLKKELRKRQIIPYILDSGYKKSALEGPTNVDAILINSTNGFAVIFEAKVLSDISYEVTYDTMRNQIARIIDVMLERNDKLCYPLNKRDPEKTLFLLLTPKIFKENYTSRLYGYKYYDYKQKPESIGKDLPHRKNVNWREIALKLGWITWEDLKEIDNKCCKWLD